MKKVLKLLSAVLGGLLVAFVLASGAFWLWLSLRPAGKTVQAVGVIGAQAPFRLRRPLIAYLPFVDYMAIDGATLYAGNTTQGVAAVVDTVRDSTVATIALGEVHGVAIDTDDKLGFASDSGTNTVDVFDLTSSRASGKIPVDNDPDAIVYDRKLHLVYVACHDTGISDVIDPVIGKITARIGLGGTAEYAQVDPVTGVIYQNVMDRSEVVVIDPLKAAVTARYRLAAGEEPTGLALDSVHGLLFVTGLGRKAFVLDAATGSILDTLPIGSGSDGIGYDPGLRRLYVANGLSATLTVIQQDARNRYRVLENAPTHFFGHSVIVNPATHRIYVAYFGNIAVYQAAGPVPSRAPEHNAEKRLAVRR